MMNKKISAVVLTILLLCISLIGCSANSENIATTTAPTTTVSTTESTTVTTTRAIKEISTTIPSSKAEKSTTKKQKTTKKSTKKSDTIPKPTAKEKSTQKHDVCYISIDCGEINSHIDNLKPGHERYVPNDGKILGHYAVEIEKKLTAYDALVKACNDNNINLTSTSTQYGKYVVGINNLDEKDCGAYSGWLYYVNGKKPSIATSKYEVKSDDNIVFTYTCGE